MKEIDFIPEWYKSGRLRQISYRTQYVALGGLFVVMVVWNVVSTHSIANATAGLTLATRQTKTADASGEFARISTQVAELHKKAEAIEEIDSKIDVPAVLAEISYLIDGKIVLSRLDFLAEKFANGKKNRPNSGSVRVARANFGGKHVPPLGDVRFKVVISGVASETGDVAELVCKLEESLYFCEVTSSWRNREIKAGEGLAKQSFEVSDFEICCYLANYRPEAAVSQKTHITMGTARAQ